MHRTISSERLAPETYDFIEAELRHLERFEEEMIRAWDGERYLQRILQRDYSVVHRIGLLHPFRTLDDAHLEETAAGFAVAARLPRDEALAIPDRVHPLAGIPPYTDSRHVYNWHVGRQVKSARTVVDQFIARVRCLRILNAMAKRNDFNAPFDSLGLPKETLVDPFDGKPLRTKKTPTGAIVYSVGPDLKDDGGVPETTSANGDVGFGLEPPVKK